MCLTDTRTLSIHVERLQISDARRKQFASECEIIVKLLARFNTQFILKESSKLLFAIKENLAIKHEAFR